MDAYAAARWLDGDAASYVAGYSAGVNSVEIR